MDFPVTNARLLELSTNDEVLMAMWMKLRFARFKQEWQRENKIIIDSSHKKKNAIIKKYFEVENDMVKYTEGENPEPIYLDGANKEEYEKEWAEFAKKEKTMKA